VKKIMGFLLLFCLLLSSTVFAAPMPEISKFRFLPNGEVYHYYYFGDEYFDTFQYNGQAINSGGIVSSKSKTQQTKHTGRSSQMWARMSPTGN